MMDPIPQDCVSTSDASYGTTTPPFIDTRSEPPAYYHKAAELVSNKQNSNSAPASKSGYSISGTQSVDPPSSKSNTKGGAKSRNEGGQMTLSDKISNDKSSTHYYKQQQQKSIKSKASNSRKGMTKSSLVSNATESYISSSKSKGTRTSTKSQGSTLKRQQSIDPPSNSPGSYYNDDETEVSGAIYGSKSPGSIAAQEDPPSVCSGDPPSVCDSTSSYGSKSSRGGSSRRSTSSSTRKSASRGTGLRNQQPPSSSESILHTWNEEEDTDDDEDYIAQEHRSIDSPDKDEEDDISSNNSSKDYSYEEGEEEDEETRCSELANAVEHALAIRRASIAESDPIHISEASSDQLLRYNTGEGETVQENAIALMESDDYNGVNSYYGNEDEEAGESTLQSRSTNSSQSRNSQQIVAASSSDSKTSHHRSIVVKQQQNYLSKAVDNYNAVVPIDSDIYEAYDHTFVTCPENLRFRFLYTFLKKNMDKKIMVFFSTTNSAKYHAKLLEHFHVPTLVMHGKQRRERFINQFFKFSDLEEGILCATDAAGRDLDIPPSVDWVVQFEPPEDPSEYILRVARISCNSDRVGRSLLFLNPGEKSGFLKYYHSASIPVSEFEIPSSLADVQSHIEYHVNESERLLRYAKDAYGSYLIAYASHGFRDVYNVHDLSKEDVAIAFGIVESDTHDDDKTAETDTLATPFSCVGGDSGLDKIDSRRSGSGRADRNKWEKKEKSRSKSWMKGEKSWPHSQIKMHPKFKGGHAVQEGY